MKNLITLTATLGLALAFTAHADTTPPAQPKIDCTLTYRTHSDVHPEYNTQPVVLNEPAADTAKFTAANGENYQASASSFVDADGKLHLSGWVVNNPDNFDRPGGEAQMVTSGDEATLYVFGQTVYMAHTPKDPNDNTVVILAYSCKKQ